MGRNRMLMCALVGLLSAGSVHAGVLDDLRNTLRKLQPEQPVKVLVQAHSKQSQGDEDKPTVSQASLGFSVLAEDGNLQLNYSSKLLARVDKESTASSANPDLPTPIKSLMGNMSPLRVRSLINVAPSLLHRLEGAKLISSKAATYAGNKVQLLVFSVPAKTGSKDSDAIDHYDGTLNIWLGSDGVPVAFSEARHFKGSKFFIHFSFGNSLTMSLRRVGNRLLAASAEYRGSGSGMGQSSQTSTHVELTLRPLGKAQG